MKFLSLCLLALSYTSLACDDGLVKNNNIKIPINSILANDMTEVQFKKVAKDFELSMSEYVDRDFNGDLQVYSSWSSNTVNAFAERKENKMMVTIYGGLARHKSMTLDSVTLTLCHELGHHLGGFPKKSGNTWSSAEGQSDYYATMKCARRIWEKADNVAAIASLVIPEKVKTECGMSFMSAGEVVLCIRTSMAGKALALLFQDLESDSLVPQFETPSDLVVRTMNFSHPYNQCRLDTYFQGALCPVVKENEFDDQDQLKGSCHQKLGDIRGLRPRCWFVPKT